MSRPPALASARGVADGLAAIRAKSLTPEEWARDCLRRIGIRDDIVRAWAWLPPEDEILAAARACRPGALYGLPVGIKDVIDAAAMPTRCNSVTAPQEPVAGDSAAVARLREAGAFVLGKTVTTEYAFATPGPTRNPLDPSRTPGGSSSGSAASVADGQVPAALTTQTGGSTIRPAAYCGIVGYKPPLGTIPLGGLRILDPAMDTIGVHARSVADAALIASILEGRPRPGSPRKAPRLFVLGFEGMGGLPADAGDVLNASLPALRRAGARIEHVPLPAPFARIDAAHRTLMSAAVARSFSSMPPERRVQLRETLSSFIARGERETTQALAEAQAVVAAAREAIWRLAGQRGLLLWPAATGEAPIGLETTGDSKLNRPWSLFGLGVITVPAGSGPAGMPLGLQIVDPSPGAPRLFPAAAFIEAALATWTSRKDMP